MDEFLASLKAKLVNIKKSCQGNHALKKASEDVSCEVYLNSMDDDGRLRPHIPAKADKAQVALGIKAIDLDNKTRWGGLARMLNALFRSRYVFYRMAWEMKLPTSKTFSVDDWNIISQVTKSNPPQTQ